MNHIVKYKLFESGINEDIIENIEMCKDFIETFNESDEKFRIANYQQGWYNNQFTNSQKNENDKVALYFNLGLIKDLEDDYFDSFTEPITTSQIDEFIEIVNKSKFLISRVETYCKKIEYSIQDKSINFILVFDNPDNDNKKSALIKRIYRGIKDYFKTYDTSKTIFVRKGHSYEKLFNLLKNNKDIDWKHGYEYLHLRYSTSENIVGDVIDITIGPFRYKSGSMERYKPLRLNRETMDEIVRISSDKILSRFSGDKDKIELTIDNNTINIKIK